MAKREIPTIGKPIFTLSVNNWNDKIKITTGLNYVNSLSYVAVNAVMCLKVGYVDASMNDIIINEGCKDEDGNKIEMVVSAEEPKKKTAYDIFVREEEANFIADDMNKQFKSECKAIMDELGKVYHEYDNLKVASRGGK